MARITQQNQAAIELLRSWRQGDEQDQRETLACLKHLLGESETGMDKTYTNLYGNQVTETKPDRGAATEEENDSLAMLERAVHLHATWCAKCETRFVQHEDARKLEVVLWGDDDAPYRTLLYGAIPDAVTVVDDVSRPIRKPEETPHAEESGPDGEGHDEARDV